MAYSAVVLAGALSALGFAPVNTWPLTLLALAVLFDRVVQARSFRDAFLFGFCFGTGHFLVGLNWIARAFTYQANMPAWYGWVAVALLSGYLALYPALSSSVTWALAARRPLASAFILSACWMLGEWLRATLMTGFAWDPIGLIWLGLPAVSHAAVWIGTYGLSGLALLVAGLFVWGLRSHWRIALVAAVLAAGLSVLMGRAVPSHGPVGDAALRVQVVQPNIDQGTKYDPELEERNELTYLTLSGAPGPTPRVLLWPEGATLHYLELEPDARRKFAALLGPHDVLLTGGQSAVPNGDASDYIYHNSVFALNASGTLLWRYDKAHLVPFGEYLPARSLLTRIGLSRLVPGEADFIPGPGAQTFSLPGFVSVGGTISVGVQICYEIIFSGHTVDEAHRPTFLFNPSNDAWFGAWGPPQHLAQARMRAIEEGIAIVRATPNGISALIGPDGRLIQAVPPHTAGAISAGVPQPLPPTLFCRYGLLVSVFFGALLLVIGLILRGSRVGVIAPVPPGAQPSALPPQ